MTKRRPPLRYDVEHRTATWLELFFDLVFVVAVSKVTHLLAHVHHGHLEAGIWWKFPLMFLPVWWIWMLHTLWSNLYDTDSQPHRAVSLLVMLQMIVLSSILTTDWDKAFFFFNLSYFGLRLTFAALYFAARKSHPDHITFATRRSVGMLLAATLSLSSVFLPPPWRYLLFYAGVVLDIMLPLLQGRRGEVPNVHGEHLVERMGLLIIILMGESVISLSAGLERVAWSAATITAAISGAVLIGAAWWIYFDSYHRLAKGGGRPCSGLVLAYPHFFTCLGLSVMANLIHHAIHPGLDRREYQLMAIAGLLVFYSGKQIPYFVKFPKVRINIVINSMVTFLLCAGALTLPTATGILIGVTVALLVYVLLNFLTTIQKLHAEEAD